MRYEPGKLTLAALEAQVAAVAVPPAAAPPVTPAPAPEPPPAPVPAPSSKVFNPDIAVIGNFLGAAGRSPGGGEPSLQMQEAEA